MPGVIDRAQSAAEADCLTAVGTSLQVYPVAGAVPAAMEAGARVVIVNAEPTPFDEIADAVIRAQLAQRYRGFSNRPYYRVSTGASVSSFQARRSGCLGEPPGSEVVLSTRRKPLTSPFRFAIGDIVRYHFPLALDSMLFANALRKWTTAGSGEDLGRESGAIGTRHPVTRSQLRFLP